MDCRKKEPFLRNMEFAFAFEISGLLVIGYSYHDARHPASSVFVFRCLSSQRRINPWVLEAVLSSINNCMQVLILSSCLITVLLQTFSLP